MRICYDARAIRAKMTGVGVYCSRLLAELLATGGAGEREWTLIHLPGAPLERLAAQRPGVSLIETTADYGSHPIGDIWLNHGLRRILTQTAAELFHGPAFLVPWLPTRARKIVTIHDLVCFRYPGAYTRRFAWYMRQVIRLSTQVADGVIAVSQATADDLVELVGTPRDKIRVIHEAAAPEFAEPPSGRVEALRARYQLPARYLLYVGAVEPRKGVGRMLRLLERLRASGVEISLVLAGPVGWKARPLLAAIEASPARKWIRRLGYVDAGDLPALYAGAVALLYLSEYEGFGLPPLEAMACGCPVVAARRGPMPEVVGDAGMLVCLDEDGAEAIRGREDGGTRGADGGQECPPSVAETRKAMGRGIASPLQDEDGVVELLARLTTDASLRSEFAAKGKRQASRFSWRRAAEETLRFYDEVAG